MKRMLTLLIAGSLGFSAAPVVLAEATLYGSVRSGVIYESSRGGSDATWDLGSVDDADKLWSRIGVKASYDLDNGLTSGLHIEKRLDNFRTRHQNVWLQTGPARLTLGQQGTTFHSATTWDGTNLYGGNTGEHDGSRGTGIKLSLAGDSLRAEIMARDDNTNGDGSGDGILDRIEFKAEADFQSWITVSGGYLYQDDDGMDAWGGTVGGSVGRFSWKTGYAASTADFRTASAMYMRNNRPATATREIDWKRFGAFLGYEIGPGTVYAYYEDMNYDNGLALNRAGNGTVDVVHCEGTGADRKCYSDDDYLLFGYSHSLGTNTTVILEHLRPDSAANKTVVALKVDF